jgi:hypothetical protein
VHTGVGIGLRFVLAGSACVLQETIGKCPLVQAAWCHGQHPFDGFRLSERKLEPIQSQKHIGTDEGRALVAVVERVVLGD